MLSSKLSKKLFKHKIAHTKVYLEGFEYDENDYNYIDNKNNPINDEKTDLIFIYILVILVLIQIFGFISKSVY